MAYLVRITQIPRCAHHGCCPQLPGVDAVMATHAWSRCAIAERIRCVSSKASASKPLRAAECQHCCGRTDAKRRVADWPETTKGWILVISRDLPALLVLFLDAVADGNHLPATRLESNSRGAPLPAAAAAKHWMLVGRWLSMTVEQQFCAPSWRNSSVGAATSTARGQGQLARTSLGTGGAGIAVARSASARWASRDMQIAAIRHAWSAPTVRMPLATPFGAPAPGEVPLPRPSVARAGLSSPMTAGQADTPAGVLAYRNDHPH